MRNRLAIVIAIAIAATAVWWMTTQDSIEQQDGDAFAVSEREPAKQTASALVQATDTSASGDATGGPSGSALRRRGPPRDVTQKQRDELVVALFESWPDLMTEFGLTGVKVAYWGEGDDSSVGYFAEFANDRQISTMRREKPVIGCSFSFESSKWNCVAPVFESWFQWPGQVEPVLVNRHISDELAFFAMSNFSDVERRTGGLIETISLVGSGPDVIRIGVRLPQDIGGGVHYRHYQVLPSAERGFEFIPTNPPLEHDNLD